MMTTFTSKVYTVTRKIPKGRVATYKDIAHTLNCKAYRAVGSALKKNPYAPQIPCHRVVNSSGNIGGFATGTKKKIALLRKEGVTITNNKIDLNKFRHEFKLP